jgi:hypothetical protein
MPKIETEMLNALAGYSGPVKRCRPGKARGGDLPKKEDPAKRWLSGIATMYRCTMKRLSCEGGEWRVLSKIELKSETPSYGNGTV